MKLIKESPSLGIVKIVKGEHRVIPGPGRGGGKSSW